MDKDKIIRKLKFIREELEEVLFVLEENNHAQPLNKESAESGDKEQSLGYSNKSVDGTHSTKQKLNKEISKDYD